MQKRKFHARFGCLNFHFENMFGAEINAGKDSWHFTTGGCSII